MFRLLKEHFQNKMNSLKKKSILTLGLEFKSPFINTMDRKVKKTLEFNLIKKKKKRPVKLSNYRFF